MVAVEHGKPTGAVFRVIRQPGRWQATDREAKRVFDFEPDPRLKRLMGRDQTMFVLGEITETTLAVVTRLAANPWGTRDFPVLRTIN